MPLSTAMKQAGLEGGRVPDSFESSGNGMADKAGVLQGAVASTARKPSMCEGLVPHRGLAVYAKMVLSRSVMNVSLILGVD